MTAKELYEMELHEQLKGVTHKKGSDEFWVFRVPGGWIYYSVVCNTGVGTFVPYSGEFKED